MNKIINKPIFWVGTAVVVGALYLGSGAGEGAGQGLNTALPIVGVALGIALVIYAVK